MDFLKQYDARGAAETARPLELRDQATGEVIENNGKPCIVMVKGASSRAVQAELRRDELERAKKAKAAAKTGTQVDTNTAQDMHEATVKAALRLIVGFGNMQTAGEHGTGADGLRTSMGTLRTSLVDLRQAIAAETARSERQRKVAALNTYVGGLTANAAGNHFVDDADLTAMSRAAGINTAGLNTSQIRNRLAAFDGGDLLRGTVYDPTGNLERNYLEKERLKQEVSGIYGTIRQMMTQYGVTTANPFVLNDKGVRSNPHTGHFFINGRHITDHNHPFWNTLWGSGGLWARFTSAETALRNTPGFATGGTHLGGLRIVGENGPELEATGPSRIFSHRQSRAMLDNSEMVRELRAVRAELAEMKAHARGTAESTRDTFKTLREINSVGVKIDPDQNKVAT